MPKGSFITRVPATIPSLAAWYDGANPLFPAANPANGASISSWADRSGNKYHATQGTGSAQPTFATNTLAGLPVLTFDGGDTLALPSGLFSIPNGNNTLFTVSKRNTESGAANFIAAMNVAGASRWTMNYSGTAGRVQFLSRNLNTNPAMNNGNTNTNYAISTGFRSGTTLSCAVNNNTPGTTTNGASEPTIDAGFIGSFDGATLFLTGGIAEIIIYSRALSANEITAINRYLANKWGISI